MPRCWCLLISASINCMHSYISQRQQLLWLFLQLIHSASITHDSRQYMKGPSSMANLKPRVKPSYCLGLLRKTHVNPAKNAEPPTYVGGYMLWNNSPNHASTKSFRRLPSLNCGITAMAPWCILAHIRQLCQHTKMPINWPIPRIVLCTLISFH